jgi:hypothetical protein
MAMVENEDMREATKHDIKPFVDNFCNTLLKSQIPKGQTPKKFHGQKSKEPE